MKYRIIYCLIFLAPLYALAQSPAKKPASKKTTTATASMAAAAAAAAALTPEERNIIEAVHTGRMACELNTFVNIQQDATTPGLFRVQGKGFDYYMTPVVTTTGAVRLEDSHFGAVWLQIPAKSMLMNQKLGKRLADGCQSTQQLQVAAANKDNPPPDLLAESANKPPHLETAPKAAGK